MRAGPAGTSGGGDEAQEDEDMADLIDFLLWGGRAAGPDRQTCDLSSFDIITLGYFVISAVICLLLTLSLLFISAVICLLLTLSLLVILLFLLWFVFFWNCRFWLFCYFHCDLTLFLLVILLFLCDLTLVASSFYVRYVWTEHAIAAFSYPLPVVSNFTASSILSYVLCDGLSEMPFWW